MNKPRTGAFPATWQEREGGAEPDALDRMGRLYLDIPFPRTGTVLVCLPQA